MEEKLLAIWQDVMHLSEMSVDDNLYALGADSLMIFRIAARMLDAGLPLEAKHLLRHPSIAELAAFAETQSELDQSTAQYRVPSLKDFRKGARRGREGVMSTVESTPAKSVKEEIVGEFPCTQTQLRCWIINQLSPGNPALNVAVRWEIRGIFKASTIEAAFRKVIQRHEVCARASSKGMGSLSTGGGKTDFKMVVIDLRNMPSEQREKRISSIGDETARSRLISAGPASFMLPCDGENDRGFLLITAHQSCFDGVVDPGARQGGWGDRSRDRCRSNTGPAGA
ncbi:phosphopantetheine-binding protein [Rhizobium mongolense]|uniref:phosphopantetheine-binding protein n=1 Tax=Rhizobium mongolense TaxID=57676 RepID=UPI001F4509C9|nr:phosphopantetheine-binding protein [Rhizobium mongolense]